MPDTTPANDQPTNPEHAIACPWCKASPGTRCTTQRGRTLAIPSHEARIDAWATTQREDGTP
jgi:hypothetical protein